VVLFTGELLCLPLTFREREGGKIKRTQKSSLFSLQKKKKKKPASRTTPAPSPRPSSPATGPLRCRRHRIGSIAAPRRPRARTLASKISRGWAGTRGRRFWSRTRRLRVWRSRTVWCP
jgi:hypothetical protein